MPIGAVAGSGRFMDAIDGGAWNDADLLALEEAVKDSLAAMRKGGYFA